MNKQTIEEKIEEAVEDMNDCLESVEEVKHVLQRLKDDPVSDLELNLTDLAEAVEQALADAESASSRINTAWREVQKS